MKELTNDQLVEFASLLVTLLIFFSIDVKFRFRRSRRAERRLFLCASISGGLATVLALAIVWVEMFLPEENKIIHWLAYFVPASVGIIAVFILAVEVLFLRKSGEKEST